jgi:hypothetical protein
MPKNSESLNRSLFDLLRSKGYDPTLLDTSGKEIPTPEEAEVFQFDFIKDGENYGKVTISIDGAHKLIIYFNDKVADSEKEETGSGDVSWYQLLNQLKRFAQSYQLSFELRNVDNLKHDMAKREYMKKKESIQEGYYPMGKKASYSDNVPSVKMIIQHSRQIEEGEQRYRNVERIFLENEQGERFLAPTTKPGIARVYARHIAEGGNPHDERWNHIGSLCEEYQKMGAFVRATRNGQFNESTQRLVTEGVNHYQKLRESLTKLAGHRGYNAYFESYTPPLMEDEEQVDLSEMFMSSSLDPRIESVMPILAKLSKNITEMSEISELSEWADSLLEAPGAETLAHNEKTEAGNLKAFDLEEGGGGGEASEEPVEPIVSEEESLTSNNPQGIPESEERLSPDTYELIDQYINEIEPGADREELARDIMNGHIHTSELEYALQPDLEESALQAYLGNKKYGKEGMNALRKAGREHAGKEKMASIRSKYDKLDEVDMEEGTTVKTSTGLKHSGDYGTEFQPEEPRDEYGHRKFGYRPRENHGVKMSHNPTGTRGRPTHGDKLSTGDLPADAFGRTSGNIPKGKQGKIHSVDEEVDMGQADSSLRNQSKHSNDKMDHFTALGKAAKKMGHAHYMDVPDDKIEALKAMVKKFRAGEEVDEGLDANQKRVGQLGPTEKVGPKGAVGKLVGNESAEANEEAITEMDKSQTPPGRDGSAGDSDAGKKEHYGKMVKPGDVVKKGVKALDKAMDKEHKKDVKEGQEDLDTIRRLLGK